MFRTDRIENHLGIRANDKGISSYYFQAQIDGKRIRKVIASSDDITIQEARKIAHIRYVEFLKGDGHKKKPVAGKLFFDVAEAWLTHHAKYHRKRYEEDRGRLERYVYPEIGKLRLDEITQPIVQRVHSKISAKYPVLANRILAIIRTIYCKAIHRGEAKHNPASLVRFNREEPRHRYLSKDEASRLFAAIERHDNVYARALFQMYLLTGCRRNELLNLTWQDVDLREGNIVIPESRAKNGRAHKIPLDAYALEILQSLPRIKEKVFPINYLPHWNAIRKSANLEDLHLHDLRRTVGSWLAQDGASTSTIAALLNHKSEKTTFKYYIQQHEAVLRTATEKISEIIQTAAQNSPCISLLMGGGSLLY